MPSHFKFSLLLAIICVSFYKPSYGQQAQDQFGKNRIQYKNFNWQFLSTYNFEVYYYEGGKELAKAVSNYAESDFQRIVDMTGFAPYSKIRILVYNTASDMQQSNIGLDPGIVPGGQTQFVKSKIEIAFKGSHVQLKNDLSFSIAQMLINIMLYGGSLKDIVQSSYLLSLPDWYVNGAATYIAEGWSVEMDNYMRDLMMKGKVKKPTSLTGKDAIIAGQSIWNFVAQKYGRQNVSNILNLTRIVRNDESSIESTLGIPYGQFMRDWKTYYRDMNDRLMHSYTELPEEAKIVKNRKGYDFRNLKMSPDGKKISYLKNYKGRYRLIVYDTEKKSKNILSRGGHRLLHQEEDPLVFLHAWQSPEVIVYYENKKNKLSLTFVNLTSGKKERRIIKEFNQLNSIAFSGDGNKMVVSGDKMGQSDIYVYDVAGGSFTQLTNDFYDDLDPVFIGKTNLIAFSSNRISDTLQKENSVDPKLVQLSYNIFTIDSRSKKNTVLKRITDYGNNRHPLSWKNGEIIYQSDEKGIRNLYQYSLPLDSSWQVSNYVRNIDEFALNENGNAAFVSLYNTKKLVYYINSYSPNPVSNPASTERQKEYERKHPRKIKEEEADLNEEKEININDYKFESDFKKEKEDTSAKRILFYSSNPVGKRVLKDEISVKGPYRYFNSFGVERVNSTFMVDPLRGTGILLEADMGDMMGNHRMNAGLFGLTDLKSSSIFAEYLYLKKRVDFKVRFDRKIVYMSNELALHRYTLNKLVATASYPLSTSSRVSLSPFVAGTKFTDLSGSTQNFLAKDVTSVYLGLQAQYVYDNTIVSGLNMIEGTRAKFGLEQYASTMDSRKNFGKLLIDIRHYHKLHKDLIFASRASYGQFLGNAKKKFLLGGMDNWLFNSTNHPKTNDPLNIYPFTDNSDLLFVEYVTNMRGFNYNFQNGAKYVLFNGELRLPIVKYFYNGVINSNFLKNLQVVGFTDIGASWTGSTPFDTKNSTNTTVIGGGNSPFTAKVTNYKSPFLIGYGVGVRTLFLGYYIKGDVAWGMLDNKVQKPRLYLTFGFDF